MLPLRNGETNPFGLSTFYKHPFQRQPHTKRDAYQVGSQISLITKTHPFLSLHYELYWFLKLRGFPFFKKKIYIIFKNYLFLLLFFLIWISSSAWFTAQTPKTVLWAYMRSSTGTKTHTDYSKFCCLQEKCIKLKPWLQFTIILYILVQVSF